MSTIALSQRTLDELGIDRDVLAYFFYEGEASSIVLEFALGDVPLDITNYTFSFKLTEYVADRVKDTKNGTDVLGLRPKTDAIEVDYSTNATILDAVNGKALLYIPDEVTASGSGSVESPTIYYGYYEFQDNASVGELIQKTPVLILVV